VSKELAGSIAASLQRLARIDIAPLLDPAGDVLPVARQLDAACRTAGFFLVTGHGLPLARFAELDRLSRAFFARPEADKAAIAMHRGGPAWRGWFPVGGELTSGRPDRKEGLYAGVEHDADHPRVRAGAPLHGANLFPAEPAGLGPAILAWIDDLVPVAAALMRGLALGLGLPATWFEEHLTADPTVLFRIFHYPPGGREDWGVGEHTDYGLLTLLAQDSCGGLEVKTPSGWVGVPAEPGVLVCNIGDMLDRLTGGRYRSTPHRVRNLSGRSRVSFPLFFDPAWDAQVVPLPLDGTAPADDVDRRWDGRSVHLWEGCYGDYLAAKVARVFPELFAASTTAPDTPRTTS
jgi:isopenicillin N synthase-like dioxygenase